ncbi:mediator of RNA polymerase II transcription subunit 28 [Venturia canescens]|uniref:mediator of RNA polymerase II transcription subunit 28 n=1 Tax=Venturia canescens TaxID=32260 RepID=UPI001C9BDFF3|nr:mediator of RNA polymerase II transcription subunit 28 [Venturia canescens]
MATPTNGNGNLVDEFEEAFQQCLNILTKEEGLGNNSIGGSLSIDKDEARGEIEQVTLRFIDLARQMEAFFLQKRFLLSALKPELVVKEDIYDLKLELTRKDDLIKRHYDKIAVWQNLLADLQGWAQSPAQGPAPNGLANGNQGNQGQPGSNGAGGSGLQQPQTQQQQQQQLLQHQQQLQQQQLQQLQQHQLQQQQLHQQQVQQGAGGAPQQSNLQGVGVGQQAMFMGQSGGVGVTGVGRGAAGFPVGAVGSGSLQGPLAFLEKTTSNIGMPERRS